jgi:hypothetical protein
MQLEFRNSGTVRVNGVDVPTGALESAAPTIYAAFQQRFAMNPQVRAHVQCDSVRLASAQPLFCTKVSPDPYHVFWRKQ